MDQYSLEKVSLSFNPRRKRRRHWQNPITKKWTRVENATLGHFQSLGWSGYAGEGDLILALICTMAFRMFPERDWQTAMSSLLYAKKIDVNSMLSNIHKATKRRIARNFRVMASRTERRTRYFENSGDSNSLALPIYSSRSILDDYPDLKKRHLIGLFKSVGNEKVSEIAKIFASDPYKYRNGWPDLTLWKDKTVAFKEVKTPNDKLRKSQRIIIEDILNPLSLDVAVVEAVPSELLSTEFPVMQGKYREFRQFWPETGPQLTHNYPNLLTFTVEFPTRQNREFNQRIRELAGIF